MKIDIDGHIVAELTESLVQIQIAEPSSGAEIAVGDTIAFKDLDAVDRSDEDARYLGTVTSLGDDYTIVVLLERVAMTSQLTTQAELGESRFKPTLNPHTGTSFYG